MAGTRHNPLIEAGLTLGGLDDSQRITFELTGEVTRSGEGTVELLARRSGLGQADVRIASWRIRTT